MPEIQCPAQGCTQTFRGDLDATVLTQLLKIHADSAHPPTAAQTSTAKMEKVRRPTISTSGTSEDWAYFLSRWAEYKIATQLQERDVVFQLLECADESLRKDLNRTHGTLIGKTEQEVLLHIKTLAVKPENVLVARVQLQNISQDRDETVRAYCARLRGQAGVCKFVKAKTCDCTAVVEVDYSEDIIRDTLIRGLCDDEIKLHILGQCQQDLTLDQTLQMVEAKESGKRSAGMLTSTSSTMNAASSYKEISNSPEKYAGVKPSERSDDSTLCSHCGQKGHGNGRRRYVRKKYCPAFNHKCSKCSIPHHFEQVCHTKNPKPATSKFTSNDAVFNENNYDGFLSDATFDNVSALSESII